MAIAQAAIFRRALAERVPTVAPPVTDLQSSIDDTIAQLVILRQSDICRERHLDQYNPDHLVALSELSKRLTAIFDGPLYEIAMLGGIASRETRSMYRFAVSDALDGNLAWELKDRADQLRDDPVIEAAE